MKHHSPNVPSQGGRIWESSVDLSEAVRRCWPIVVSRFSTWIKGILPDGGELTRSGLAAQLPVKLDDFISLLGKTDPQLPLTTNGQRSEVDLAQLLAKFGMFRRILLEEIAQGYGQPLGIEESSRLNETLDSIASSAILSAVGMQHQEFQQAVDAQNRFLAVLTHDLRGNLNAILLTLQVLQRSLIHVENVQEPLSDLDHIRKIIMQTIGKLEDQRPAQITPARKTRPKTHAH